MKYGTFVKLYVQGREIKYRASKVVVPHLCGYCGRAVDSIISVSPHLNRSGFNLEFETLLESM